MPSVLPPLRFPQSVPPLTIDQLVTVLHACGVQRRSGQGAALAVLAHLDHQAATKHAQRAIPHLLVLRMDAHPSSRDLHHALERTLALIVTAMPVASLLTLDRTLRPSPWKVSEQHSPWTPARGAAAQQLTRSTPSVVVCGLLASHPSGYVREVVVAQLARRGPAALPWLLVRSVDWVAVVQGAASRAVQQLLADHAALPTLSAALVAALPLVGRLPGFTRVRAQPLTETMHALLLEPPAHALTTALAHPALDVRCAAFELLRTHARLTPAHLELALLHGPARLRLLAARQLGAVPAETPVALCEHAFTHGRGQVRSLALSAWANANRDSALPTLRRAVDDADASVRSAARWHLTQALGPRDFAAHYRALVARPDRPTSAVAGLGEVGTAADWELLVPALDASTEQARAAIRALRALNTQETRELRLMLVDDPRPGVSVEAARSVLGELRASDLGTLEQYLASPHAHVRRNAVRLCGRLSGWGPIVLLLGLEEPALTVQVHAQLVRCFRARHYAVPATAHQRERLLALVPKAARILRRNERELGMWLAFVTSRPTMHRT